MFPGAGGAETDVVWFVSWGHEGGETGAGFGSGWIGVGSIEGVVGSEIGGQLGIGDGGNGGDVGPGSVGAGCGWVIVGSG